MDARPPARTNPPATPPAEAEAAPAAVPPATPGRRSPLVMIVAGVAILVVIGLVVAWLLGAFAPKMARLPARVGTYALDSSTQKSTATLYDSATYRAGAGDIYQASIVKNAADPAIAYGKAAAATRLQSGDVYCVGVSKTGNGGTCAVLLPTGSAVFVDGSTRHPAADIAQFAADLKAAIK